MPSRSAFAHDALRASSCRASATAPRWRRPLPDRDWLSLFPTPTGASRHAARLQRADRRQRLWIARAGLVSWLGRRNGVQSQWAPPSLVHIGHAEASSNIERQLALHRHSLRLAATQASSDAGAVSAAVASRSKSWRLEASTAAVPRVVPGPLLTLRQKQRASAGYGLPAEQFRGVLS